MTTSRRRRAVVVGVVVGAVLLLVGWIVPLVMNGDGEGASGAGFTYRGEFYALSDAEVRPDRLGEVLDEDVAFQDTTTEVRRITGLSAETAVAASIDVPEGKPGEDRQAWLLLSPNPDVAADPWSDPELAQAVRPRP